MEQRRHGAQHGEAATPRQDTKAKLAGAALTARAGLPIVPRMNGFNAIFGICREIIR